MKKLKSVLKLIPFLFLLIFISGCKKDSTCPKETSDPEKGIEIKEFVFGRNSGFFFEEKPKYYGIQNGKLYSVETRDGKYFSTGKELSNDEYLLALNLHDEIPEFLRMKSDTVYRCLNVVDQGSVTIQFYENGVKKRFSFDSVECEDQPAEINSYWIKVLGVIHELTK